MLKKTFATLAAAAVLAASAGMATAQDYTLRATATSNDQDEDYDGLVIFKDYVEKASNGAIEVELFIGTQLCGNGTECLQGVADGSIDIFVTTSGGAAGIFPYVQVFDLPYLMRDDRVAEAVLTNGTFTRTLRDMALEDSGGAIRIMTIGNTGGWRNFANTQKRIAAPSDLEGMKMRTVVADLPQELVKTLGGSPTPIPWPELFTSLQTGVVEGTKNGVTDIMNMKFTDAGLKYLTLDGHAYMAAIWVMNNERFQSMPDDLKRVVVNGFNELQQATFASPKRKQLAAYQAFTDAGGEIYVPSPDEMTAFSEAVQPVYDWFSENVDGGSDVLQALRDGVAAAEEEIDAQIAADIQ
ncbi:2,3-diketo-L-gulonate-binding periplasmic protein YiaO precursor (plasmid) [Roseivivax sp. THAF40]|uniref:TRAP transporter substrate-binding protein n=1 Tax=unclassified Roseivivax TaxID=2639302 RepID=UPI001268EF1A|nr:MULTISPECIES: TRAP transporter substrate-binding protein DctP [unclassified Roseivivax]QFS84843.1 2,3-diketo-L-gulonate-binding periplasmic protein YiaO precursor [Roseivivax sp. THAF197b]QFT48745.1 2,3-diketo-L-gulonate-binding periplasmic protein YiaO precursor [Roseivivax sp. THAF40]